MASDCSSNTSDIFDEPSNSKKYRFFNQPIEQIPDYIEDKPQLLVHRPDGGLQWVTLDLCLDVVTCLTLNLESEQLQIERRKIVVIKDFEPEDDCPPIDVTTCPTESGSPGETEE
jgi:hypothetical protein